PTPALGLDSVAKPLGRWCPTGPALRAFAPRRSSAPALSEGFPASSRHCTGERAAPDLSGRLVRQMIGMARNPSRHRRFKHSSPTAGITQCVGHTWEVIPECAGPSRLRERGGAPAAVVERTRAAARLWLCMSALTRHTDSPF